MYITIDTVHNLCIDLVNEALKKSGNYWSLSKDLGVNHCTLNNLRKHPERILNSRHVFALIRFIGTERAMDIINRVETCSVEEFMKEKQSIAEKLKKIKKKA